MAGDNQANTLSLNIPSKYLEKYSKDQNLCAGGGDGAHWRWSRKKEKNFEGKITSPTMSGADFPLKASLVQRIKKYILERYITCILF